MLRRRSAIALAVAVILAVAGAFIGIQRFRYRLVRSDADLFRLLPAQDDPTLFYASVAALRDAGYLRMLEGTKLKQEGDYTQFVQQSGFNYAKDLDAVAGAVKGERILVLLRGRFRWKMIEQYAKKHSGSCEAERCNIATSTPGRWANLQLIQPDVLALTLNNERQAASIRLAKQDSVQVSDAPVWVRLSNKVLANPAELPMAFRMVAISLQSSDSVVLSLRPADASGTAFSIQLDATCANAATAETARTQLQQTTNMLKVELAREHKQADPADLTGLLTAGTFQIVETRLVGSWPVRRELLASLE